MEISEANSFTSNWPSSLYPLIWTAVVPTRLAGPRIRKLNVIQRYRRGVWRIRSQAFREKQLRYVVHQCERASYRLLSISVHVPDHADPG